MKTLAILSFALLAVAVATAALSCWRNWQHARYCRELDRRAYNQWLDRVEAILRQYGKTLEERTCAQWKADFDAGLGPMDAAKGVLKRLIPSEFKMQLNPHSSNTAAHGVSTTWNLSSQ